MPHWGIWIIVALACGIAEIATLTFFMGWFGVGAFAAAIADFIGVEFPGQFLVFIILSITLVLSTKRLTAKWTSKGKEVRTNVYGLVGKIGYVTEGIPEGGAGQVKVEGEVWTAVSSDGTKIPSGAKVSVINIEGVHLIVKAEDQ